MASVIVLALVFPFLQLGRLAMSTSPEADSRCCETPDVAAERLSTFTAEQDGTPVREVIYYTKEHGGTPVRLTTSTEEQDDIPIRPATSTVEQNPTHVRLATYMAEQDGTAVGLRPATSTTEQDDTAVRPTTFTAEQDGTAVRLGRDMAEHREQDGSSGLATFRAEQDDTAVRPAGGTAVRDDPPGEEDRPPPSPAVGDTTEWSLHFDQSPSAVAAETARLDQRLRDMTTDLQRRQRDHARWRQRLAARRDDLSARVASLRRRPPDPCRKDAATEMDRVTTGNSRRWRGGATAGGETTTTTATPL